MDAENPGAKCQTVAEAVISCRRKGNLRFSRGAPPRITVYLFGVGHCGFLLASLFGAETVISHPGPQGPKTGPPGQDGDNRSAEKICGVALEVLRVRGLTKIGCVKIRNRFWVSRWQTGCLAPRGLGPRSWEPQGLPN